MGQSPSSASSELEARGNIDMSDPLRMLNNKIPSQKKIDSEFQEPDDNNMANGLQNGHHIDQNGITIVRTQSLSAKKQESHL